MPQQSNVIRVPKPADTAFNPHRLLAKNTLLVNQVESFRKHELGLAPDQRTGMDFASILTEGQASEYIRKMTAIMHPQAAKTGGS